MDLLSFLTTRFLDETLGGRTAPPESDVLLQQLELMIARGDAGSDSPVGNEESGLIRSYLDLSIEEIEPISPEVHEWFLDRLTLRPMVDFRQEPDETVRQVGRLFFLSNRSTQQYLVVSALLALDERVETPEGSSVAFIWNHIWDDGGLTDAEKQGAISVLAEILLDQHYFCRPSRYPIRAIAQLLRSEQRFQRNHSGESRTAYARVSLRARLLGEKLGGELATLLRQA